MALPPDLLGTRSAPLEFAWTADDAMLYALAVGAGQADPADELALTTENSGGRDRPLVLPGFANIVTRGVVGSPTGPDDPRVLHAEQAFRVAGPLPAAGRARVTSTVVGIEDKRSGVLVRMRAEAVDAATGAPLADVLQTIMIRGETGGEAVGTTGGEALVARPGPLPDRDPDERLPLAIRPDQALLYRLTGDRNPLHSDPDFARRAGFERPILHGMCTYGCTARTLTHRLAGGDPSRLRAMDARFTRPVLPGDTLEVALWHDDGGVHFRTTRDGEPVLDRGWAELG